MLQKVANKYHLYHYVFTCIYSSLKILFAKYFIQYKIIKKKEKKRKTEVFMREWRTALRVTQDVWIDRIQFVAGRSC